jgi:hypothetical protein
MTGFRREEKTKTHINYMKRKENEMSNKSLENTLGKPVIAAVKEIAECLKIDCPIIESVAYIYDDNGILKAHKEIQNDTIPAGTDFFGGYFNFETNKIFLARKYPVTHFGKNIIKFKDLENAEILFTASHELRHVWQFKNLRDTYYAYNAKKMEVINDPAEIDADAFAIAFVFCYASFSCYDMPNLLEDIFLQCFLDGGKRWKKSHEIAAEYNWEWTKKIDEAKDIFRRR